MTMQRESVTHLTWVALSLAVDDRSCIYTLGEVELIQG